MKVATFQVRLINVMMLVSITGMADTIDTVGQEPYEQCGYCHEYDGNSLMPSYPKLAQQMPGYIKKQLRDFRAGKRMGQMQATAELLSDEDIEVVARYFSQQKLSRVAGSSLSKSQHDLATRLFMKGDTTRDIPACSSCHGAHAEGMGIFPRLAGQHEDYLAGQLKAFKSGTRGNDEQGTMRELSQKLSAVEIKLLAGYLSALPALRQPGRDGSTSGYQVKTDSNQ